MVSTIEKLDRLIEEKEGKSKKKWSQDVKTNWDAPEGLFTKSATVIAKTIKANHKDLRSAMGSLNFYINMQGKNLSIKDKERLNLAKEKLRELYSKKVIKEENALDSFWVKVYKQPYHYYHPINDNEYYSLVFDSGDEKATSYELKWIKNGKLYKYITSLNTKNTEEAKAKATEWIKKHEKLKKKHPSKKQLSREEMIDKLFDFFVGVGTVLEIEDVVLNGYKGLNNMSMEELKAEYDNYKTSIESENDGDEEEEE